MSGFKRAIRIIILAWFISMLSAMPYAFFTKLNYVDRPLGSGNILAKSAFCALLEDNIYPENYPVYELSSILFFLLPTCVLTVLYIRMGLKIRQTSEIQRNLPSTPAKPQKSGSLLSSLGSNLQLSTEKVLQNQEKQFNAAKRSILRMLGNKSFPLSSLFYNEL